MKVIQLRRLLRTLPPEMKVLLEDLEGIFGAHEDDFAQLELPGAWGPKALVISPCKPPLRRPRPFKPAEASHPIERLRAHQHWVASKPQRDAWTAFLESRVDLPDERPTTERQMEELVARIAPENTHPPRLE
jgi:hypothetical protein